MSEPHYFHPICGFEYQNASISIVSAIVAMLFALLLYLIFAHFNGYIPFANERDLEESLIASKHIPSV